MNRRCQKSPKNPERIHAQPRVRGMLLAKGRLCRIGAEDEQHGDTFSSRERTTESKKKLAALCRSETEFLHNRD